MSLPTWLSALPGTSPGWISWLVAIPVVFSAGYWWLTARWLRRRFQEAVLPAVSLENAVFFRPVKRGVPALEEKARRLLSCARPGDWVLFGVDSHEDAAQCEAACNDLPAGVCAQVILCPPTSPASPNPKITKLAALARHAGEGPQAWILTDSEAVLERDFMDRFRSEWRASGGVLTAGYRFTGESNLPQRFDHLSILLTLWPGMAAAERRDGTVPFTLGACTAIRRGDLAKVGGWERFATYLAEDNRLGIALNQAGIPVRLAREVLVLDSDPLTWSGLIRHQHRMALTYRVCNPAGTLGMFLTHGLSFAVLLALLHPASPLAWGVVALTLGIRTATVRQNAQTLGIPLGRSRVRLALGIAIASLGETVFWLVGWLPLPVRWGTRRFRIVQGGRLRQIGQNFSE